MMRFTRRMTRRTFAATSLGAMAAIGAPMAGQTQGAAPVRLPIPPDVEKANVALVNAFCAAWGKGDITTIGNALADNCAFRISQSRPPIVGKQAVMDAITGFLKDGPIEFKILKTVVLGPVVLNEREDYLPAAGGRPARVIRIHAGMFFVANGKIVEWTDYAV